MPFASSLWNSVYYHLSDPNTNITWAYAQQNQQNDLCAQPRLRSALAFAQSNQSSLSALRKFGSLATDKVHIKNWSDWAMPRLIWVFARRTGHFVILRLIWEMTFEPQHNKTNKMVCGPSEDSDQPGHLPSLIRAFAVCSMGSKGLSASSGGQQRLWSDWADAQADLSLRWAHMSFCRFCHEAAHLSLIMFHNLTIELAHSKTYKITFGFSKDSDQPAFPRSLARASAQSYQSHCCLLTQYRELEEASDKEPEIWSQWMCMRIEGRHIGHLLVSFLCHGMYVFQSKCRQLWDANKDGIF